MKKFLFYFIAGIVCTVHAPGWAITIHKAAPVAAQESSTSANTASLVPTVLNLIGTVQQLNAKQKELTAECIPSSQEITFVNNMVKEWAKTGTMNADEVSKRLGMQPCRVARGGYQNAVRIAADTDMEEMICYDYFAGDGNDGMPWAGFPMATTATYCSDGSLSCSGDNRVTVSNVYDIFNLIDFTEEDYYGQNEVTMAANLMNKIESCSNSRLSAKKRELWGEFLTTTINSLGQPTNSGSIMETVSSITGGGGLGSLGSLATSLLGG